MLRPLALLLFIRIVLTFATTPTPDNTHTPVKLVAVPHPDVFIPLKEWKRQRLEDIESRVRKAEEKRNSPRLRRSDVCKPRARLLAFLARVDICPPSADITGTPNSSSDDARCVSAKHAHGDVNRSEEILETVPPKELSSDPKPAVSPLVDEQGDDSHLPENVETSSVQPSAETVHHERPIARVEHDELTGRIEDYIPIVLPKVLPKVIPKVGEIVKSLKEVSLAYTSSGDTPPDSLNLRQKPSGSTRNSTGNSTSQNHDKEEGKDAANPTSDVEDRSDLPEQGKGGPDKLLEDEHMLNVIVKHSNDAGVKEKPFNYASIDAGARVLAFSDGVVGATNVILGSNDKYLLSPCAGSGIAGSRFVDLELSEEVILESIETGNFEHYSSSPRKIAVLGASTYPPKKWNVLGIFDFANVKRLQKFQIEKRGVTRYLRVIFAGKQGTEYYCPISTVRAFGKTLLADWKELLEKPSATRKPLSENGGGSKSKTEKESDKSKSGNTKSVKKPEQKLSEKTEKCSDDDCKNAKDESTAPESPTALPKGIIVEGDHSGQHMKDVDTRSDESERVEIRPDVQPDDKTGIESDNERGDDTPESDVKPTGLKSDDEKGDPAETTSDEENNNDENPANYGDSDHVSEDDQVVIDALRSDTLSPVDGDDNIFRKVTRMLRLLELNQTLTNQYIDTQLSKFAVALSDAHSNSRNASERVEVMQRQLKILVVRLENRIEELTRACFRRDVLLCILLVCVAFLLGTHWILWSAVSAARIHEETGLRRSLDSEVERIEVMLQPNDMSSTNVTRIEGIASEGPSPAGKRKKRKGRRPFAGENMNGGYLSGNKLSSANGLGSEVERGDGRSTSSFEISSNGHRADGRRRFGSSGGTFDVLGQLSDQ